MKIEIKIKESDVHQHLKNRILQRGISIKEIEETINKGWNADDIKEGTLGKVLVFPYKAEWERKFFEEKEVTVYYKYKAGKLMLLTAKARYGKFKKEKG